MSRTRTLAWLSLVILVSSAACHDGSPPPAVAPDAGLAIDCSPSIPELTVSAGGRLRLPDAVSALVTDGWELSASPGLSLDTREDGLFLYPEHAGAAHDEPAHIALSRPECDEARAPVDVRPLEWTTLAEWDPSSAGPPGREYGAWWIHDDALFVFGGFHYFPRQFTPASDLWRFDLATSTWSSLASEGAPLAPGGRAAEGSEAGVVLLHGGSAMTADGSLDTPPMLFEVDARGDTVFFETAPHADGAPGSYTGAFVHDARRDRWLSICGVDARRLGAHCGVYEYRESSGWQRLFVEGDLPAGRFGFHYAYDAETDRVIVVGGQIGPDNLDMIGDTWALELGEDPPRWTKLFDDTPELRRRNGAYVLDPIGRRLILWGGTADGRTSVPGLSLLRIDRGHERWDHVPMPESIPPRASGLAAYDAARERAIFGFGNGAAVYTDLYALSL